jgi:GxxExxY protein
MTENQIAAIVVDAALKIHKVLDPGCWSPCMQTTLAYEVQKQGLRVVQQVGLPVHYEGVKLELGYRVDLIIDDKVIIEIKSVEALAPVHKRQLLTYLRLKDLRLGLLINFNVELIKDGIYRVVNRLVE